MPWKAKRPGSALLPQPSRTRPGVRDPGPLVTADEPGKPGGQLHRASSSAAHSGLSRLGTAGATDRALAGGGRLSAHPLGAHVGCDLEVVVACCQDAARPCRGGDPGGGGRVRARQGRRLLDRVGRRVRNRAPGDGHLLLGGRHACGRHAGGHRGRRLGLGLCGACGLERKHPVGRGGGRPRDQEHRDEDRGRQRREWRRGQRSWSLLAPLPARAISSSSCRWPGWSWRSRRHRRR